MLKIYGSKFESKTIDILRLINHIQHLSQSNDITIQLFNAKYIYGKDHLNSAFTHAKRAFDHDRATASVLAMEILLYASGEYQIKNAIDKLGVKEDSEEIAVLINDENNRSEQELDNIFAEFLKVFGFTRDDGVLNGDVETLESFGISRDELSAIPENKRLELVLEKVALVDIQK